jgi:ABC-2 type transport system permease protein
VFLWMTTAVAYLLFWLALALAINAAFRSAAVCAIALTTAYVAVVIGVPSAASLTAHVLMPVPSRMALAETERQARFDTLAPLSGAQDAMIQKLRRRFPYREGDAEGQARYRQAAWEEEFDVPTDVPLVEAFVRDHPSVPRRMTAMRLRQTLNAIRADHIEARLAEPLAAIANARRGATRIVNIFSVASPALAVSAAVGDVSGTSEVRRDRFMEQFDGYARSIRSFVYPSLYAGTSIAPAALAARKPFTFSEEPVTAQARRVMARLAVVLIEAAALFAWALTKLRRSGGRSSRGVRVARLP